MTALQFARTFFGGIEISDSELGYILWNETAFPFADERILSWQLKKRANQIRRWELKKIAKRKPEPLQAKCRPAGHDFSSVTYSNYTPGGALGQYTPNGMQVRLYCRKCGEVRSI